VCVNNWEKTLQRFCALGGTIENVKLGEGALGRGIFPKDNSQPIKMVIPNHLLCRNNWLQIDAQGKVALSSDCDWNNEIKSFYLDYQHDYGIGSLLMKELMQEQTEIYSLPVTIKNMLMNYGIDKSLFDEPSPQVCLDRYKNSRRIIVKDKLMLMPLIELVNHDEKNIKSFDRVPNLGISGKFKDEVLVNYGLVGDAALMFEGYGFSVPKPYTFSGALGINLGSKVINIARFVTLYKTIEKTNVPRLKVEGDNIHLSCLVIGSVNDKSSPKKVFIKLMHSVGMPATVASDVFDAIVEQNKNFFLLLLEELNPLGGAVAEGLRMMAKNQLIPLGVRI
jgi:hypothetical protein